MRCQQTSRQKYLIFCAIALIFSCTRSNRPDVSQIKLDIKIERFDHDLYAGKNQPLKTSDSLLKTKYKQFYNDFLFRMVGNSSYKSEDILHGLYTDKAYTDLNHEVDSVFPNLKPTEEQLTKTFQYIKYYYPKAQIPRFIGFLSGFAYQSPVGDNYIGIGLDMFLGAQSKFYGALVESIPLYVSRRFTPEYIVPRTTEVYLRENVIQEPENKRSMLDKMIYNGKILYFLDQVLPENTPDSVKIGYTKQQLEWCKSYEGNLWAYYLENKFIYETDYNKIQVFFGDGPFTPGLGDKNNAAPKLGVWTGWQIVKKYMKENPDITLRQLMENNDAQSILTKSKYKPRLAN
jgi:gliding motility-associated lipoprotein GldB